MIYYGKRIIYDKNTGKVLNGTFEEMEGELQEGLRPLEIDFIDLPYGYNDNNFKDAIEYHIDTSKNKLTTPLKDLIIITKYREHIKTPDEQIAELENQLLLQEDANVGGIL